MEVLLRVVADNVGTEQPPDHLVKTLTNNRPILQAASKRIVEGSTELLQAVGSINSEHTAAILFCLGVQTESLEAAHRREFFDRALPPLQVFGRTSVADMQKIRNGESHRIIAEAILIVSRKLVDVAHALNTAGRVILPLERIACLLCPNTNTLTTLHSALMEVCIQCLSIFNNDLIYRTCCAGLCVSGYA